MKRKQLSTEFRAAIWEAHKKRCPYTGELIAFSDLDIDHVVPVTIAPDEFTRLVREGKLSETQAQVVGGLISVVETQAGVLGKGDYKPLLREKFEEYLV